MKAFFVLLAVGCLGAVAFFGFEAYERKEITQEFAVQIAPIVDYKELYQFGHDREANDVLLLAVVTLLDAEDEGADLEELFRQVEWINQTPIAYSDFLKDGLLRNLKIARELGLDSPENRALMREGKSPIIQTGPYAGEKAEVDHIVPKHLAEDLDNLLINLELMPMTLNRRKSKKVTPRVRSFAKRFHEAGVMLPASHERVMKAPLSE